MRTVTPRVHRAAAAPLTVSQVRHYHFYVGIYKFHLPAQCHVTKEQIENTKWNTASRQQWNYHAIDERVTAQSEFNNMRNRPDFDGPRPDNSTLYQETLASHQPHFKKLHEHFDEYTKPGANPKFEALMAVKEHWDSENFYYPGEQWQRNRPSFRSVPAELLNKQTWYHWIDTVTKFHEIAPTTRLRQWNPIWPPPGYKVPALRTKREFVFGVEEPGLMTEIERFGWHKMWLENNARHGPWEVVLWFITMYTMWHIAKCMHSNTRFRTVMAGLWYPGKQLVRPFGEPRDPTTGDFWWQQPLDQFPNQGEVWYYNAIRWKYIHHLKKQAEEELLAAELAMEE